MTKQPLPQRQDRQELERALEAAIMERDRALSQLADARVELNRLRLASVEAALPCDEDAQAAAAREVLPLRYQLADRVNELARVALGPGHGMAKAVLATLRALAR